jgi:hypothetical protein
MVKDKKKYASTGGWAFQAGREVIQKSIGHGSHQTMLRMSPGKKDQHVHSTYVP